MSSIRLRKKEKRNLGQSQLRVFCKERTLRVGDVATREIARVGDEDDGRARGLFKQIPEAPRDLATKDLRGSLVDVAYGDERVRRVDERAELCGRLACEVEAVERVNARG